MTKADREPFDFETLRSALTAKMNFAYASRAL